MRKWLAATVLGLLVLVVVGCGESGEKGKNKEKDVPKPARPDPAG